MRNYNTNPEYAWIFDIDGVITDPITKQIKYPEIIQIISEKIRKGEPFCGNTGRSIKSIEAKILPPLKKILGEFKREMYFVGEKGATVLRLNDLRYEEKMINSIFHGINLSEIHNFIKDLVRRKYKSSMFFDETKEVMVTVEMLDNCNFEFFKHEQAKLAEDLISFLSQFNYFDTFRVDKTTIATDVEHIKQGKGMGARLFVEYLASVDISPKKFLTFGDSYSDLEMATELDSMGYAVDFIYVGEKPSFSQKHGNINFIFPSASFTEGTLEYLNRL